jgi:hypothetical protein
MAWWNGLSDRAREIWLERAGTAVAADAWAQFKADPGIAFEVGLQEGREIAAAEHARADIEVTSDRVVAKLARDVTVDDVLVIQGIDRRLFTERIRTVKRGPHGDVRIQSGPVGHALRVCNPADSVDVLRK